MDILDLKLKKYKVFVIIGIAGGEVFTKNKI